MPELSENEIMDHQSQATKKDRQLPMARSMCWHCQSEVTGEYLCGQCVKVQPLSKDLDYFSCFQLPRFLNIDEQQLEQTFYELSRTFHPDFYSTKDESEKAISLGNSAFLNTGYRTLKDPIQRAEYLIRLEAGAAKDIRSNPPADLFEEVLELHEDLETFRQLAPKGPSSDLEKLQKKLQDEREHLEKRQTELESALKNKFTEWDQLQKRTANLTQVEEEKKTVLRDMQEILSHRTYVRNMVNDLLETTA